MTTSLRDLRTGDKFSCRIQNVAVTGTVTVGRDYIYLCQNKKNGGVNSNDTKERHGHKYTWTVLKGKSDVSQESYLAQQAVTHFRVTKAVARETKVNTKALKKAALKYQAIVDPVKVPVSTDEEIAATKKKLADLEAKKAQETQDLYLLNWKVTKTLKKGKPAFSIGCGAITVTEDEAGVVATVLNQILTRSAYDTDGAGNLRTKLAKTLKVAAKLANKPHLDLQ